MLDERIEEIRSLPGEPDVFFYYRFQHGHPAINIRQVETGNGQEKRRLRREDFRSDQSVLAQRKDPELYPEVTSVGSRFGEIQLFREWTFGRFVNLRTPQPADLPGDRLLPDASNLALVLNEIEHQDGTSFNEQLRRFFPRFQRMSTRVLGGTVQFYLHESDIGSPIPATRLSDGTIRFVAMLASLFAPSPPPLVCIEEPELGLHPDAVAQVGSLLIEASNRMQLIVTTHSESLVSALSDCPDAVVACERPGSAKVVSGISGERECSGPTPDMTGIAVYLEGGGDGNKTRHAPDLLERISSDLGTGVSGWSGVQEKGPGVRRLRGLVLQEAKDFAFRSESDYSTLQETNLSMFEEENAVWMPPTEPLTLPRLLQSQVRVYSTVSLHSKPMPSTKVTDVGISTSMASQRVLLLSAPPTPVAALPPSLSEHS